MSTLKLAVLMTSAAVAACGGGGGDNGYNNPTNPTPPSTSNAINVRDNSFAPSATTVAVGTTVTWTWVGTESHNVTFSGGPASNNMTSGTYQRTFGSAGTFNYSCTNHAGMNGSVTVQ